MKTIELLNRLRKINDECKKAGMTILDPVMSEVNDLLNDVFDPENEMWEKLKEK